MGLLLIHQMYRFIVILSFNHILHAKFKAQLRYFLQKEEKFVKYFYF